MMNMDKTIISIGKFCRWIAVCAYAVVWVYFLKKEINYIFPINNNWIASIIGYAMVYSYTDIFLKIVFNQRKGELANAKKAIVIVSPWVIILALYGVHKIINHVAG